MSNDEHVGYIPVVGPGTVGMAGRWGEPLKVRTWIKDSQMPRTPSLDPFKAFTCANWTLLQLQFFL